LILYAHKVNCAVNLKSGSSEGTEIEYSLTLIILKFSKWIERVIF